MLRRSGGESQHTSDFPNLFILGAPKCGTTTVYRILGQHPEVYFPFNKEPQFFCVNELYSKGLDYYIETFFKNAGHYPVRGDATPHYLFYETVAKRIAAITGPLPPKFIVVLRDPVARAYSHYWNMVKEGVETLSFEDAVEAEESRLEQYRDCSLERLRVNYVSGGMYAQQLQAYFKLFPRSRFHILLQEDLSNQPKWLDATWDFLEVPRIQVQLNKVHNAASSARSASLQRFLRQPNRARKILGRWLSPKIKFLIASTLISINSKANRYPPLSEQTARHLRLRFTKDISDLEQILDRSLVNWKR